MATKYREQVSVPAHNMYSISLIPAYCQRLRYRLKRRLLDRLMTTRQDHMENHSYNEWLGRVPCRVKKAMYRAREIKKISKKTIVSLRNFACKNVTPSVIVKLVRVLR